jgi:hypothetical protein
MVRFTRGHLLNHVGKNAATNPKLQARPVESSSLARKDSDLSIERGVSLHMPQGDNSLKLRR